MCDNEDNRGLVTGRFCECDDSECLDEDTGEVCGGMPRRPRLTPSLFTQSRTDTLVEHMVSFCLSWLIQCQQLSYKLSLFEGKLTKFIFLFLLRVCDNWCQLTIRLTSPLNSNCPVSSLSSAIIMLTPITLSWHSTYNTPNCYRQGVCIFHSGDALRNCEGRQISHNAI